MPLVATLVSHPAARALSPALARSAASAGGASGIVWLAEGLACDLALPQGGHAEAAERAIRAALAGAPVDVAVQEAERRRKRLLVADMDSTIIDQECIDELAAEVGLKDRVGEITERAMRGEIGFEPALRERVALLKGLEASVIERVLARRITVKPGTRGLVATMRAFGARTALVSGGFESFTKPIAALVGFDEHQANRLLIEDSRLTGRVAEPILGRAAKAEALRRLSSSLGITPADAIAVGDGANDLDMLHAAGTGVAFHAKPAVAAAAKLRIEHADLTALLFLQGYRESEFVR
ncbi:MAG TPA: phosphoserine phosphatase SerB [Mesorhizobium sp.]|jgi:phosphoserine phosphatase|nr:phosphoserine phosphatase SerB [Mesorhizobium sp.]